MDIYSCGQKREEYINVQINRSKSKFSFCKVFFEDVEKYYQILLKDAEVNAAQLTGPILCLGTRSGREIDLFRGKFFNHTVSGRLIKLLEAAKCRNSFLLKFIESVNRSDLSDITENSVIGVEVNPEAVRQDTWIGSFDEMPKSWENKFNIVYSNSFDHSYDVNKTVKEWKRVIRPGGYLILGSAKESTPSATDRVANISLNDILNLFGSGLIFFQQSGSVLGYTETIIKIGNDK